METKSKKPIVGELAIVWDIHNRTARIELYKGYNSDKECLHVTNTGLYKRAILFESEEQFKEFVNY